MSSDVASVSRVDVLEALLEGPRARGAFLIRALVDPPWSLRIEDEAPLTLMTVMRGEARIWSDSGDALALHPGQVALVRGPDHYTVADCDGRPPEVVVLPGGRCTSVDDGRPLWDEWSLGVRTWGHAPDASCVLLVGTYEGAGEASRPLLSALPPLLVHDAPDDVLQILSVLAREMQVEVPGQRVLLDRLLDVLLIATLRTWFTARRDAAPGWFRAQHDREVRRALGLLHQDVARAWTVADLAGEVGISRAALARRFSGLLGEPPMTYLAGWRLALTADLLRSSDATVASIAREVGYGTPFSLSAAFKRAYGTSPQQYRSRTSAGGGA